MFEALSKRLLKTFDGLRKRGVIREADLDEALHEIRVALLESDVALEIAKNFVEEVRTQALGQQVIKSVTPDQMIVKIVHDHLIKTLEGETPAPPFSASKTPLKIIFVGLQGSGKTTSAAKVARLFTHNSGKRALLASTDVYRPAAIEQLAVLTQQISQASFVPSSEKESPLVIAQRALEAWTSQRADLLVLDTAGRLHTDDTLMEELEALVDCIHPDELILVVDMMTGQDALNIARTFSTRLPLTGIMLTRAESESRGGVALSMRVETGCPIRLLGTGEHLDQLEVFDAKRIANRLLGMGDVVALVEQAEALMQEEETQDAMAHFQKGTFTLEDFRKQLKSVNKMGGMAKIVKMLPGAPMLEGALRNSGESDQSIMHQIAIISSMTPKERRYYKLINGPRRRRIAVGSGRPIQEVNKLIRNYERLLDMQKKLKKLQDRPGFSDKLRSLFG